MKKHLVLPCAVLSLLAGCTSQFATGIATSQPVVAPSDILLRETAALKEELSHLQKSYAQIAEENQQLREQSQQMAAEHSVAVARVEQLSEEMRQLYRNVADKTRTPLPSNWHQRLIEANQPAYAAIRDMLGGITEDEFPTVRTWYGRKWKELIQPFAENRFPTESQRDGLLSLLDEILAAEHKRMIAMKEQSATPVALKQSAAVGLGDPRWEKLSSDLRALRY